jgi:4-amino-4-deoxy-L-arabinose transferase-like glycosyltransferase
MIGLAFLSMLAAGFLLRIFYARHLYQDDGLWFTAAEEVLRGKALYGEIYFDKPPLLPMVYAALFGLFGPHVITIRLFTILYALAVSSVIYLFGSRLYDRRTGLFAAALFTVFSTTYTAGHVQGLNTDLLMTLPYAAGAYLLVRSFDGSRAALYGLAGGAAAGLAFQVNPKGAFDLVFFAALLIVARRKHAVALFSMAAAGFLAGALPLWLYIASKGALSAYGQQVWEWGARYATYYPIWKVAASALGQSAGYFALNNTLFVGLVAVVAGVVKQARRKGAEVKGAEVKGAEAEDLKPAPAAGFRSSRLLRSDVTLLVWLAASYAGMSVGGRFFGHYFLQIIPALCLIAARGLTKIFSWANQRVFSSAKLNSRRAVVALIIIGFIFTLVRFHSRTATLALEWARGAKSTATAGWFHEKLNREERMVAAVVRDLPDAQAAALLSGTEAIRENGPRTRQAEASSDYLFVWGYRPEIYYWSGLLPASRYLSSQPLTGVPADVHYFGGQHGYLIEESRTAPARIHLLGELERTRPKYIVDELGFFNNELAIANLAELREFMRGYKKIGTVERFMIYRRKDLAKKKASRAARPR